MDCLTHINMLLTCLYSLHNHVESKMLSWQLMTACLGPHTAPPLSSNVHKLRLSFSCALRFPNTISGQSGTLSCQYGLWYGPPVRTTPYSCTSPRLPPWLIQTPS
ncbi:hypothetical protein YC2023_041186 [Brassica napus]